MQRNGFKKALRDHETIVECNCPLIDACAGTLGRFPDALQTNCFA